MELGISSPLTQTGTCKFVKGWLVDTATVYRIGIIRTGVFISVLSAGNIAIGGTVMALNMDEAWSSLGLCTGFPLLVNGITCLLMRRKRPENKVSLLSACCLMGLLASIVSMVTSIISIWSLSYDPCKLYPWYSKQDSLIPLYVMNAILLALSPSQLCFTLWALCLSVGYVWPCLRPAGSNIFTIMVEDEPLERALVSESDTELAAFSGHQNSSSSVQGVLQIQSDWIQTPARNTAMGR